VVICSVIYYVNIHYVPVCLCHWPSDQYLVIIVQLLFLSYSYITTVNACVSVSASLTWAVSSLFGCNMHFPVILLSFQVNFPSAVASKGDLSELGSQLSSKITLFGTMYVHNSAMLLLSSAFTSCIFSHLVATSSAECNRCSPLQLGLWAAVDNMWPAPTKWPLIFF